MYIHGYAIDVNVWNVENCALDVHILVLWHSICGGGETKKKQKKEENSTGIDNSVARISTINFPILFNPIN